MWSLGSEMRWLWLIYEAGERLAKRDPNHELLRLFYQRDAAVWNEFQARFGPEEQLTPEQQRGLPVQTYFWERYCLALESACNSESAESLPETG